MFETISISRSGDISIIKLDNESTMNAMSQLFLKEFHEAIENVRNDKDCRVLILRGTEKVFSAGGNLHEIAEADYEKATLMATNAHYIYDALLNLDIPVIAALDGIVYGGGLELALRCDIRFCTPETRMKFPEVDMGIIPGAGGISFLSRYIPPADIAYYVYSCKQIPVEYAKQHGIVQEVFSRNELYAKAEDFAKLIASKPREALRAAKHEIIATMSRPLSECLQIEIKEFAATLQNDGKRIIKEWFEKKKIVKNDEKTYYIRP